MIARNLQVALYRIERSATMAATGFLAPGRDSCPAAHGRAYFASMLRGGIWVEVHGNTHRNNAPAISESLEKTSRLIATEAYADRGGPRIHRRATACRL